MKSTSILQNDLSQKELEYKADYLAKFNQYLEKQHPIVRGLHVALKVLSLICFALTIIFFIAAMYYTILWAATGSFSSLGKATYLPDAWVNFGLSMSFLVFPWGLDAMLLRAFPPDTTVAWRKPQKPVNFSTGLGAFFAGFGVMCAGAPGAARMITLASQAIQKLL